MNVSIKKIVSSKVFWILGGLFVLSWLLREYLFWGALTGTSWGSNIVVYLVFRGPTVLPLIFPAVYFYLFARKRDEKHFNAMIKFLIVWPIWSYFATGFFSIAGPRDLPEDVIVFLICPIVIIAIVSIIYLFHCGNILNKKDYLQFIGKKKSLWISWFIGLSMIITGAWVCMRIGAYLGSTLGDRALSSPDDYIYYLTDLFLMWLIITLPASLKIDSLLDSY